MPKQSLDHLRSKKKPVSKTIYIAGDSELAAELEEQGGVVFKTELQVLRRPADEELAGRLASEQQKYEELLNQVRESSIKFRVQSIGRKKMEKLVAQHPPTEEDIEEIKKTREFAESQGSPEQVKKLKEAVIDWSPRTFPIALVAKCVVEPELTEQELLEWLTDETWNESEIQELFTAAMEVNMTHRVVSLGKGSRTTQDFA